MDAQSAAALVFEIAVVCWYHAWPCCPVTMLFHREYATACTHMCVLQLCTFVTAHINAMCVMMYDLCSYPDYEMTPSGLQYKGRQATAGRWGQCQPMRAQ